MREKNDRESQAREHGAHYDLSERTTYRRTYHVLYHFQTITCTKRSCDVTFEENYPNIETTFR